MPENDASKESTIASPPLDPTAPGPSGRLLWECGACIVIVLHSNSLLLQCFLIYCSNAASLVDVHIPL